MGDLIIVGLFVITLVICACIFSYVTKKVRKSADEVCDRANNLIMDIGIMESDLIELRQQIMELSDALYEISDDEDEDEDEVIDSESDE